MHGGREKPAHRLSAAPRWEGTGRRCARQMLWRRRWGASLAEPEQMRVSSLPRCLTTGDENRGGRLQLAKKVPPAAWACVQEEPGIRTAQMKVRKSAGRPKLNLRRQ